MNDSSEPASLEAPEAPGLHYVATLEVDVDEPVTIGKTVDGIRKVVPIRGGRVFGPAFSGRILSAGADFQQYPSEDLAYLSASYILELTDGHRILVENHAIRTGSPADLAALMDGGKVDANNIYFRCCPRLTAEVEGPYNWINRTMFIGSGQRQPESVFIYLFRLA
ncbi:DUF3237 domain-containing protein [Paenarthrobacter nitroguajacolicus]|uniref:DUF3237 domain-containing protein n=1 Tax=Paenarthrobacter nitroguajacolicus TaxID=211146 RepID=UPI00285C75F8|nr:DUF3237 domain-containing protein [Paenarthrobacter nitroguajacolicus]MDR6636977.1 hypothetical protein [Paenarthrobacter nitroguajacolicus]